MCLFAKLCQLSSPPLVVVEAVGLEVCTSVRKKYQRERCKVGLDSAESDYPQRSYWYLFRSQAAGWES